eukprot:298019-Prorocentrum_minimum.AAC.1
MNRPPESMNRPPESMNRPPEEKSKAAPKRASKVRGANEHLAQRVGQVLFGAQHVRDSHGGVVDGDTKVVHGEPVGPDQHKVSERVRVPRHLAAHLSTTGVDTSVHTARGSMGAANGEYSIPMFTCSSAPPSRLLGGQGTDR